MKLYFQYRHLVANVVLSVWQHELGIDLLKWSIAKIQYVDEAALGAHLLLQPLLFQFFMSSAPLTYTWSKADKISLRFTFRVTSVMVSGHHEDVQHCG